jgi:uncharacterized surface protein with fasciclin (FAS1) repeats
MNKRDNKREIINSFPYMNKSTAWTIGVVAVILILIGLWWAYGKTPEASTAGENATSTATSTAQQATTTSIARENRTSSSALSVIASLPEASTFSSYLSSTGVSSSVSGTGPYTIFVPNNAAFAKLAAGTVSALSAAQKKRLVQYHIVSGKKIDIDAVDTSTIQALSKDMLNFQAYGGSQGGIVNSSIVLRQYNAKNGVVYIVNTVLLPPLPPLN